MEIFSFLAPFLSTPASLFLLTGIVLFVYLVKKTISILFHAGLTVAVSVSIPFVAKYLGISGWYRLVPNMENILFFITLGLAAFVVYMICKIAFKTIGFLGKGHQKKKP
ncbi:MAG: hypothetical protein HZB67_00305 [Candidatus Aenigmarchaeota archaeon]|nr:hypothetical protein [Candidatus Aenigmarchaeota archaeon]